MLGQGPLSSNPLSSLGSIQSATIIATGGLLATGAATLKRGAAITATSGLRLTGAATIAARHWLTSAARTATPRYERRRVTPKETS